MFCGQNNTHQESGIMRSGTVEGTYVKNILLDTGCSRTLIHRKLVPEEVLLEGKATMVCCAHGATVLCHLAKVHMEVEGKPIEVEAAVSDRLPVGVLLATDVSQLPELLTKQNSGVGEPEKAMGIMTIAAVRKHKEQKVEEKQLEEKCGVTSYPLMKRSREPKQRAMIIIRRKKTRVKRQIR